MERHTRVVCRCCVLLFLVVAVRAQTGPSCPRQCNCDYYSRVHTINCDSQSFDSLPPDIPTWTTSLSFDGNFLPQLNLSAFNTTVYYEKFRIRYNEIERIVTGHVTSDERGGLSGACARTGRIFPRLVDVNLRGNRLRSLPKCLLSVWSVLKMFNLNENEFESVKDLNLVEHLYYYDSLEELYLRRNRISSLRKSDLYSPANGLRNVKILDLGENRIVRLDSAVFMFLPELRDLRLDGNQLRSIPPFAFVTRRRKMKSLLLNSNRIDHISTEAFAGLPLLSRLDLRDNNIRCLTSSFLSTCLPAGTWTRTPPPGGNPYRATMDLSLLVRLRLRGNPWHCDCSLKAFFDARRSLSFNSLPCRSPARYRGYNLPLAMSRLGNCTDGAQ